MNQPKQKHFEKLASRTERIVEIVKELGFFPEDVLHPVALHNAIENRDLYRPLKLTRNRTVDRFSTLSPMIHVNLVVIRSGATWQITRTLLVPTYASTLIPEQVERANRELLELQA